MKNRLIRQDSITHKKETTEIKDCFDEEILVISRNTH